MKPYRMANGECLPKKSRALLVLPNPRHKRYIGKANLQRLRALKIANEIKWRLILAQD